MVSKLSRRPVSVAFVAAVLASLAAVIALVVLPALAGDPPGPKTYYVSTLGNNTTGDGSEAEPWQTISYALGQVLPGDTIVAEAGTYDAALGETFPMTVGVIGLTLKSADGIDTTIQGDDSSATLDIRADDVVLDGFTVTGALGATVRLSNGPAHVTIINNQILLGDADAGILVESATTGGLAIDGNIIEVASGKSGVYANDGLISDLTVSNNQFGPVGGPDGGTALNLLGMQNVDIIHNAFDTCSIPISLGGGFGYDSSDILVYGNSLTNSLWADILIYDDADGDDCISDVTIACNSLSDSDGDGVRVEKLGSGVIFNVAVNWNNIVRTAGLGVNNLYSGLTVDATNNWWGDESGPYHGSGNPEGDGSAVSDYVLFDPWLPAEANVVELHDEADALVATYDVEDFLGQDYPFNLIQAAVDDAAAGGYRVAVNPGLYPGQVHVSENLTGLTIESTHGAGITIIDAMQQKDVVYSLSQEGRYVYPAVWLAANDVVFGGTSKGLTVTNAAPPESQMVLGVGVVVTGSGCVVEGNDVTGNPLGVALVGDANTLQHNDIYDNDAVPGIGVFMGSSDNSVLENNVTNNGSGGIMLQADPQEGMLPVGNRIAENDILGNGQGIFAVGAEDTEIESNHIVGHDMAGINLWSCTGSLVRLNNICDNANGVYMLYSSANTVSGNSITYQDEAGIVVSQSGNNEVSDNQVTNNGGIGFHLGSSSWNQIVDNDVADNGETGIRLVESSDNVVAGNNVTGNEGYGIYVHGSYRNTIGGETEAEANVVSGNSGGGVFLEGCGSVKDGEVIPGDNSLLGNTVSENGDFGIALRQCYGNMVGDNTVTGNQDGVGLRYCGQIQVEIYEDHEVVLDLLPGGNTVSGNVISGNLNSGVKLAGRQYIDDHWYESCVMNTIGPDNEITGNGTGVYDNGSYMNTIKGNTVSDNLGDGIYVTNSSWEVIGGSSAEDGNTVSGNENGIRIYDKCENDVTYNVIQDNGCGIMLEFTWGTAVVSNTVSANEIGVCIDFRSYDNGIVGNKIQDNEHGMVVEGDRNQVLRNIISGNTGSLDAGSAVHFTSDASGNRLHFNDIVDNASAGCYGVNNLAFDTLDARWNWWGDDSGPYDAADNPFARGDRVSGHIDYEPWAGAAFGYDAFPFDADDPALTDAVAVPDMISVCGYFTDGDVLGHSAGGFTPGPGWTIYILDAADFPEGVPESWLDEIVEDPTGLRWVVLDRVDLLRQLFGLDTVQELEQMAPPSGVDPEDRQEWRLEWLAFLEKVSQTHMEFDSEYGLWYLGRSIGELAEGVGDFFGEEGLALIHPGEYQVLVTLVDWTGNQTGAEIELTVVDAMLPLGKGWNLRSTPVALQIDDWAEITHLGSDLNYDVALRWNSELQTWEQLTDEGLLRDGEVVGPARLQPMDAIAILCSQYDQVGLVFDNDGTAPPSCEVNPGWNLIGLSTVPPFDPCMCACEALASIEGEIDGARGYVHVLSILQYVDYGGGYWYGDCCLDGYDWHFWQQPFLCTEDGACQCGDPVMGIGGGYWVFSERTDTLAGFGVTPIPGRWIGLAECWAD